MQKYSTPIGRWWGRMLMRFKRCYLLTARSHRTQLRAERRSILLKSERLTNNDYQRTIDISMELGELHPAFAYMDDEDKKYMVDIAASKAQCAMRRECPSW